MIDMETFNDPKLRRIHTLSAQLSLKEGEISRLKADTDGTVDKILEMARKLDKFPQDDPNDPSYIHVQKIRTVKTGVKFRHSPYGGDFHDSRLDAALACLMAVTAE